MQIIDEELSRRAFVKLGAAGVAVATAHSLLANGVVEEQGVRPTPEHPVVLRSSSMEVVLDAVDGVPFEYRLHKSGIRFAGEGFGQALKATVHSKSPFRFATVAVKPTGKNASGSAADFHFAAIYAADVLAAEFTLRYGIEGNTVRITLEDVKERPGFEFVSLSMPSVVTVDEAQELAWLAHGDAGGDLVALADAKAGKLRPNTFWGEINGILPVIMVGHSGAVCVQETTAYMMGRCWRFLDPHPDDAPPWERRRSIVLTGVPATI